MFCEGNSVYLEIQKQKMNLIKTTSLFLLVILFISCKKYKAKYDDTSPELTLIGSREDLSVRIFNG
jgi:hypothetical protein